MKAAFDVVSCLNERTTNVLTETFSGAGAVRESGLWYHYGGKTSMSCITVLEHEAHI
jgi:hypothetical protein